MGAPPFNREILQGHPLYLGLVALNLHRVYSTPQGIFVYKIKGLKRVGAKSGVKQYGEVARSWKDVAKKLSGALQKHIWGAQARSGFAILDCGTVILRIHSVSLDCSCAHHNHLHFC